MIFKLLFLLVFIGFGISTVYIDHDIINPDPDAVDYYMQSLLHYLLPPMGYFVLMIGITALNRKITSNPVTRWFTDKGAPDPVSLLYYIWIVMGFSRFIFCFAVNREFDYFGSAMAIGAVISILYVKNKNLLGTRISKNNTP